MLNQTIVRDKIQVIKGGVKNFLIRFHSKADISTSAQGDGIVDVDPSFSSRGNIHEFTPDENLRLNDEGISYDRDLSASAYEDYEYEDEEEDFDDFDDSDFQEDSESGQGRRYS